MTINKLPCSRIANVLILVLFFMLNPAGEGDGFISQDGKIDFFNPYPRQAYANASSQPSSHRHIPLYVEGELLVKFKPHTKSAARQSMHKASGAMVKKRFSLIGTDHIKLPAGLSVKDALKQYKANPLIEYAEPNYFVRKAVVPDDTYFSKQWGLHNTGQLITAGSTSAAGTPGADIAAPEAWDTHTGNNTITVAVIDTGIDYEHPDLSSNIWINSGEIPDNGIDDDGNGFIDDTRGWNFVENNKNPMDNDVASCDKTTTNYLKPRGHGTHVAGIVGALGNNKEGTSGVNWTVKLMPLKFLDQCGDGAVASAVTAIEYAVSMGARVINASYTYPQLCLDLGPEGPSLTERDAIKAARDAGILFVAAAGNAGCNNDETPFYPASHGIAYKDIDGKDHPALDNVISVAASDQYDNLYSFSNYGKTSVHVAAPGMNIFSTIRSDATGQYSHISGYDFSKGTSMASPFVAGLAALVWSQHPLYSYQDVKDSILNSVEPRPAFSGKTVSGGRINAFSALTGIPARPGGLTASFVVSGPAIRLSWIDNSNLEQGFRIERKTGTDGSYSLLATTAADSTSYKDPISKGLIYYYRISAYNENGESSFSDEANAKLVTLTVLKTGTGSGTVTSSAWGLSCGTTCSASIISGERATLTAAPDAGSTFAGWTGSGCKGTDTCRIRTNADKTVTAPFNICTTALPNESRSFKYKAASGSINITTNGPECPWTAVSNDDWITIKSGGCGTGKKGNIKFSVTPNSSSVTRTGTITISDKTFTITQSGKPCTYTINPVSNKPAIVNEGGDSLINVTASPADCNWTANDNANWITITSGSSGTGSGTVSYSVSANNTKQTRTGRITIGSNNARKVFSVRQAK